jgi:deoxyribodipyrimidine photo-lyase
MKSLFWHRRDLRIDDNAGLFKALKNSEEVISIFIFDSTILDKLPRNDQRVLFIHQEITRLKQEYQKFGSDLEVFYGDPVNLIPELAQKFKVNTVYTNRDYEPLALDRDKKVFQKLEENQVKFIGTKDHVIFEKDEIMKGDHSPYTIFTPYMRKWKEKLNDFCLKSYPTLKYIESFKKYIQPTSLILVEELNFKNEKNVDFPEKTSPIKIITNYENTRDFPSVLGTSRLSLHLRFGTISIRKLAREAIELNDKYLNELIWRDFYQMIIFHFPHSVQNSFKKQYDAIVWENNEVEFQKWCKGETGYPIVDAGMRELNATGFMHNRVRMIVASFLTKHLLIDWRWGETYFAEKLLDFELASNVGGWQWAASSGCDAAPYFRVFSPKLQQEKFDKNFEYIRKWVPEFGTDMYAEPIVDHVFARERVLKRFKEALENK